jgi:CopG family nickel-responsive transcriptional regulator
MEEYTRFTVSLPKELHDKFEEFRERLGISRSDAIRKAMQSLMISEENVSISSGNVVGCISIIMGHEHYQSEAKHDNIDHTINHHHHDYSSRPTYANIQQSDEILKNDIQHHFYEIIISTMHVHLEFNKCLEIIIVSGPIERVKHLKRDLQALKSVFSTGFFIVDADYNDKPEK